MVVGEKVGMLRLRRQDDDANGGGVFLVGLACACDKNKTADERT